MASMQLADCIVTDLREREKEREAREREKGKEREREREREREVCRRMPAALEVVVRPQSAGDVWGPHVRHATNDRHGRDLYKADVGNLPSWRGTVSGDERSSAESGGS